MMYTKVFLSMEKGMAMASSGRDSFYPMWPVSIWGSGRRIKERDMVFMMIYRKVLFRPKKVNYMFLRHRQRHLQPPA